MKAISLVAALLFFTAFPAQAEIIHFTGNFTHHNNTITLPFSLDNDTEVRLWTDLFLDGLNFDPLLILWAADGSLIGWSDDEPYIEPATQTYGDAGYFELLAAGDYFISLSVSGNFAAGLNLSDGFFFDADVPVSLAPTGEAWSLWLEGVDRAGNGIPEPALLSLLCAGVLVGCALRRRRSR
ncbi:hypothetical protein AGMMS50225_02390 [Betaproteobacteria bacterium]|nr:hypothetical protein AGMMS50225_02390 [Betaproteobacteria bacterium]